MQIIPGTRLIGGFILDSACRLAAATLLIFFCLPVQSEQLQCDWWNFRQVTVEDGWIEAEQGRDEDGQRLRLAVWGPEAVTANCAQLDSDTESEIVVTSRGLGTGPYYRLQIVDFHAHGIRTWAYSSDGLPKVEADVISLGKLVDGYQGAGSTPTYTDYRLTDDGLVDRGAETNWILFATVAVNDQEVRLQATDQRSRGTCEITGGDLVERFRQAGLSVSYACKSNLEFAEALAPFID